jgi:hypothetical protein
MLRTLISLEKFHSCSFLIQLIKLRFCSLDLQLRGQADKMSFYGAYPKSNRLSL